MSEREIAYVGSVADVLGDLASTHVSTVLPPHIRSRVVERCDVAYVFEGKRWQVGNRRAFATDIRKVIGGASAAFITCFFEWRTFRLVVFAVSAEADETRLKSTIENKDFVTNFGEFEWAGCRKVSVGMHRINQAPPGADAE